MNELEQKYISSKEVATMVEKNHSDLLKDIRRYVEYLTEGNFPLSDFFKESTYKDSTGRTLNCYLVSKKGCEFIAHKLTGQKGAIFTARYIDKFHTMEEQIQKPMSQLEVLQLAVNQMVEQEKRLASLENKVSLIEAKTITTPTEYFSIAGFAALRNVRVDISKARMLGFKASKLSKKYGYEIGKVADPRFGTVGTYHIDILNEIFKEVI